MESVSLYTLHGLRVSLHAAWSPCLSTRCMDSVSLYTLHGLRVSLHAVWSPCLSTRPVARHPRKVSKQANMALNVHRNCKAYQGRGEGEKGLWICGKREIIYLSLHCHHQNGSRVKMGSDESQFNVSLTVRDKVTRQCPETTIFEEKGEPKQVIRTEVPLLTSLTPYCWAKRAHL